MGAIQAAGKPTGASGGRCRLLELLYFIAVQQRLPRQSSVISVRLMPRIAPGAR